MSRISGNVHLMSLPVSVTWRDGVHITGTPFWCDARRSRDVCFVSHADAVRVARHGQLIATAETLALLERSDKNRQAETVLSVPYDRPFSLGTRRIELFASGHSIGSASLMVDIDGHRVVYAGPVNPRGGGLGEPAQLRACQTLVIDARYGSPDVSFPAVDEIAGGVATHCVRTAERDGCAVLLVESIALGLDVCATLIELAPIAHRAIHHAARRLSSCDRVPSVRRFSTARPGDVVVWPVHRRDSLDRVKLPEGSSIVLLSGAAAFADAVVRHRADIGFPWTNHADHRALLEYVDATSAQRVYFTSKSGEALARATDRPTRPARALGPPLQMSLF